MNSGEIYQKAYYLQYEAFKYKESLKLYKEIVEKCSYSQEAKYAKTQIASIMAKVSLGRSFTPKLAEFCH